MRTNSWKRVSGAAFLLLLAYACGPTSRRFHGDAEGGAPSADGGAPSTDGGAGSAEGGAPGEAGRESAGGAAGEARVVGRGSGGVPQIVGQMGRTPAEGGDAGASGEGGALSQRCQGVAEPCLPNATDLDTMACGRCGTGKSVRTRTCRTDCTWGPWSAYGECTGATGECDANMVDSEEQKCGACDTGHQTRTRTCSPTTCTWGPWGGWSACGSVTAECEPNHWKCCGTHGWMWCFTDTCQWTGDCDVAGCAASSDCDC
jgi:hypothetical protein